VWNEPDNGPAVSQCDPGVLAAKAALVEPWLSKAFAWARAARPSQPLTSAIWLRDWSAPDRFSPIQHIQLSNSDVISFLNYEKLHKFARRIRWLKNHGRPLLC